jgi:hypothetical protein
MSYFRKLGLVCPVIVNMLSRCSNETLLKLAGDDVPFVLEEAPAELLELEEDEVDDANVFDGDDAGEGEDAELGVMKPPPPEDAVSVSVGRKTPLYVVDSVEDEEIRLQTLDDDVLQHGIDLVVLVGSAVKTPE